MAAPVTVLLVGQCQVTGLRDLLAPAFPGWDIRAAELWDKTAAEIARIAAAAADCGILIAQRVAGPRAAPVMAAAGARQGRRRTLFIHRLAWHGTAPDCRHVAGETGPLPGPVMTYHSGAVLQCFRAGQSETMARDALGRFSPAAARAAWAQAGALMHQRETDIDVPFAAEMAALLRQMDGFHTFNHPVIALQAAHARRIAAALEPGTALPGGPLPPDRLGALGSFAVYPAIRAHLDLPYDRPGFAVAGPGGLRPMPVAEFVAESYAIYRRQPPGTLAAERLLTLSGARR